jgi:Fe2+ or Zn2+ uptake regulation protein
MDKNFEFTYEHLSEPRNVHTIFWKCGQKHEIMDKNFESTYEYLSEPRNVHTIFWKMWTKT